MSKTSEFPMDILEIHFILGMPRLFRHGSEGDMIFSSKKLFLVQSKKFGIPKIKLEFKKHRLVIQKFRSRYKCMT